MYMRTSLDSGTLEPRSLQDQVQTELKARQEDLRKPQRLQGLRKAVSTAVLEKIE